MKRTFAAGALFAALVLTWFLWPVPPRQEGEDAKHKHGGQPDEVVDAEVLAIDPSSRSVTLRHGPITHLGLSPSVMTFWLADGLPTHPIQVGDKVTFQLSSGSVLTVMSITPVK